jgi:hypothetical protein
MFNYPDNRTTANGGLPTVHYFLNRCKFFLPLAGVCITQPITAGFGKCLFPALSLILVAA